MKQNAAQTGTVSFDAAEAQLIERLSAFAKRSSENDQEALSSLTDFPWDQVYAFRDGHRIEDINAAVGAPLFTEPNGRLWTHSTLLAFVGPNGAVNATMTPANLQVLACEGKPYQRRNTVIRASGIGSPPWLVLAELTEMESPE